MLRRLQKTHRSHRSDYSEIYFVRSARVMLDADLARLYGVATKNLNKAVKRNMRRFPQDFMFQLSPCFRQLDLAPFDLLFWPHLLVNPLSAPGRSEALRRP